MDENSITVEVTYALPEQQLIITLQIPQPCNIENAIQASGILLKFPEIDLNVNKVGIFGKLATLETSLRHMDRIEIYRVLIADPKTVRRNQAEIQKQLKLSESDK